MAPNLLSRPTKRLGFRPIRQTGSIVLRHCAIQSASWRTNQSNPVSIKQLLDHHVVPMNTSRTPRDDKLGRENPAPTRDPWIHRHSRVGGNPYKNNLDPCLRRDDVGARFSRPIKPRRNKEVLQSVTPTPPSLSATPCPSIKFSLDFLPRSFHKSVVNISSPHKSPRG